MNLEVLPNKKEAFDRILEAVHGNEDAARAFAHSVLQDWPDESLEFCTLLELPNIAPREDRIPIVADSIMENLMYSSESAFKELYSLHLSWTPEDAAKYANVAEATSQPSNKM
ncbi:hypothetical protein [Sulfitobacter sp. R18_1]|uniref:hypothetical protein n=1 Tax=Sulfitobacter sp. R18_1 TaxID=2821104 RepID=UPI001AD9A179|nr:hypothetical protein [Sulfitobacter sp. R18_1]MBO9428573.1 hypothetical protein [Sulfitobacter sp. R18_1]